MKITVDIPVMNAQGKGGRAGKTIKFELDTQTREVAVHPPDFMLRTPTVGLAGLEAALEELKLAADAGEIGNA